MKRKFLFEWYSSPAGKRLRQSEREFLRRSITVGCQQTIVQLGGLGWENEFIDCSLYQQFIVIDLENLAWGNIPEIKANFHELPLQTETVDMVIMPHFLEFDAERHQTLREVSRILKPEGQLIILNFNPWSLWLRYQYVLELKPKDPWRGYFMSRFKILDWLKLLDFEAQVVAGFNSSVVQLNPRELEKAKNSLSVTAYGIKAIKRRYHLIPLEMLQEKPPHFTVATAFNSSTSSQEKL